MAVSCLSIISRGCATYYSTVLLAIFLSGCGLATNTPSLSPSRSTIAVVPVQVAPSKTLVNLPTVNSRGHAHEELPTIAVNRQQLPVIQVNGLTPPEPLPANTPVIPLEQPKSAMLFSSGGGGDGDGHRSASPTEPAWMLLI